MNISEFTANSLSEFIIAVNDIKTIANSRTKVLWFRGQPDKDHHLVPSISRNGRSVALENELVNRFKAKGHPFLQSNKPDTHWQWLFIMQHFGLPTRLLDWTEEALIALTFTVHRSSESDEKDAVVWCMEPVGLNSNFNFRNESLVGLIPNVEESEVTETFDIRHLHSMVPTRIPIAIYGPLNNERIIAQRGVFTLFPPCSDIVKLNEIHGSDEFLYKIIIPRESIDIIKEQLTNLGIRKENLFPGIPSVVDEIKGLL